MTGDLVVFNRQRTRVVNLRLLRRLIKDLLAKLIPTEDYELTVHIVSAKEMAEVNRTYLDHAGSTDVITLDYGEPLCPMTGEIFVCVDEALIQAARFRTSWQLELARYIVHGILHLKGYDDRRAAARRKMKLKENALVRTLARRFDLRKVGRKPRLDA